MASNPLLPELPSRSYAFEPELHGPAPRQVPAQLVRGPYAARWRKRAITLAVAGAACLALALKPAVDSIAEYVPAVAYIHWLGGALLLAALICANVPLRRRLRYVSHGQPLAARVIALSRASTRKKPKDHPTHAFAATIAFVHPDTGETESPMLLSDNFSSGEVQNYEAPFKVGDDVTAIYLPGRLWDTLRLYAFLGLSPDVCIRRHRRGTGGWESEWAVLTVVLGATFFCCVAALGYVPLLAGNRLLLVPLLGGGLVLGGGLIVGIIRRHNAIDREHVESGLQPVREPFFGDDFMSAAQRAASLIVLLPTAGIFVLGWAILANILLDRSEPLLVPATVVRRLATNEFLVRKYELRYRLDGSSRLDDLATTPDQVENFNHRRAVARVKAGLFGWRWVQSLTPDPSATDDPPPLYTRGNTSRRRRHGY